MGHPVLGFTNPFNIYSVFRTNQENMENLENAGIWKIVYNLRENSGQTQAKLRQIWIFVANLENLSLGKL